MQDPFKPLFQITILDSTHTPTGSLLQYASPHLNLLSRILPFTKSCFSLSEKLTKIFCSFRLTYNVNTGKHVTKQLLQHHHCQSNVHTTPQLVLYASPFFPLVSSHYTSFSLFQPFPTDLISFLTSHIKT